VAGALAELLTVVNSKRSLDDILEHLLSQAARLLSSDGEELHLIDEGDRTLLHHHASRGLPVDDYDRTFRVGLPPAGVAAERQRTVVIADMLRVQAQAFADRVDDQLEDRGAYLELVRPGPASKGNPRRREKVNRVVARGFRAVVSAPLLARGMSYGALTLYYRQAHVPSETDLDLIAAFAGQAGLAIENARLHQQAEQRLRELEGLYRADGEMYRSIRLDDVLAALIKVATELLAVESAGVATWDASGEQLVADPRTREANADLIGREDVEQLRAAVRDGVIAVDDAQTDRRIPAPLRMIFAREGIRSQVLAPIVSEGQVVGAFGANSRRTRQFNMAEQRLLLSLAQRAGQAIDNARLYTESDHRRAIAEGLRELLAAVNAGRGLDEILDVALIQSTRLLQSDAGAVYLAGSDPQVLSLQKTVGYGHDEMLQELPVNASVTGAAVVYGRPVVCDLMQAFPWGSQIPPRTEAEDRGVFVQILLVGGPELRKQHVARMRRVGKRFRTMLSVPLIAATTTYGALALFYRGQRRFTEEEIEQAGMFAGQVTLAIQNAQLHAESERRRRAFEALYKADEQIYQSLRLDDVLQSLVHSATDLLQPDKVAIGILDPVTDRVVVGASRGFSPATARESLPAAETQAMRAWLADGVVTMPDVRSDARLPPSVREANQREGIRSTMTAPIRLDDEVIGAFGLSYCLPRSFSVDEQRLLQSLAQRAGMAIRNARLYEQSQLVATLEERQRLARELHDSVSQALYAISLYTEIALQQVAQDKLELATQNLRDARDATREALGEMRLLIFELRPPMLVEYGLAAALRARLKAVEARAGVETDFQDQSAERLGAAMEQELYRLAQEALNNIQKHAHATRVEIRLNVSLDRAGLEIADNGVGFEPLPAGESGGLGLRGMRERVARMHGTLDVKSAPGAGTRVRIEVPR
jgi:signal transduction histidine kinase